jgi:hypothetical protein
MKRTTILLEEDLLLEVQQLAKEQQTTTSQVIQQAVADYVEGQRRIRSYPAAAEEPPAGEPSEPLAQPIQPVEQEPEPAAAERQPLPAEGMEMGTRRFSWLALISLVVGALSAMFALIEFLLAAAQLTGQAQPMEVLVNYVVPGLLLGVVAAAFLFIASQSRRSRPT